MQYQLLHTPEGLRDIYNGECERKIALQRDLEETIKKYGYQSIQTPGLEYFDIFSRETGSISSREMYKFFDREGNTIVLRPDITPSVARCAAKYFKDEVHPIRLSYTGNTYINNSLHQGKLNETTQVGAELINDSSAMADAEILAITIDCLKQAGLLEFQVEVGHADFFNGLMEEGEFNSEEILEMKHFMESKNQFGIEQFVKTKKFNPKLEELFLRLPELFGSVEHLNYALERTQNKKAIHALERLLSILSLMDAYGLSAYITIDLGMLSKYDYYTGIIMKAYTYKTGEAVAQGGRYDRLMGRFGMEASAVGLVFVLDQLILSLSRQKLLKPLQKDGILLLYTEETNKEAVKQANVLRRGGKKVTLLLKMDSKESYTAFAKQIGAELIIDVTRKEADGKGEIFYE